MKLKVIKGLCCATACFSKYSSLKNKSRILAFCLITRDLRKTWGSGQVAGADKRQTQVGNLGTWQYCLGGEFLFPLI